MLYRGNKPVLVPIDEGPEDKWILEERAEQEQHNEDNIDDRDEEKEGDGGDNNDRKSQDEGEKEMTRRRVRRKGTSM